ncbi:MAG: phenylalanine--tRNA ligase subunit alpha [Halobacteriota archaeon]
MQLTSDQHAVLAAASATEARPLEAVAEEAGIDRARAAGAAFALEEADLVDLESRTRVEYELTEEAEAYLEAGLPERRLHRAAVEAGALEAAVPLGEVLETADLEGPAVDIALSNFARKDLGRIGDGRITVTEREPGADPEAAALEAIATGEAPPEAVVDALTRRDLVVARESVDRTIRLTDAGVDALMGGAEVADAEGAVRPSHLVGGTWREVEYAPYNVEADAAPVAGGKRHVLRQVADRVKEVLVGMGFREMTGPHVDADFWINDCLFMPQDHPARTHWDRFELAEPTAIDELPADLVERVERAHREGVGPEGEGYDAPWDEAFARKLALRGHTTSLSARYLSGEAIGDLEPPQRFFSVEKVYRNDTLDPTHLLEFFQIEGWVMAEELSVRDLMGTFTEFYERFGITDLQFKPHYNPYTEPSFELFGHHPETGELIEIGNSGMFRP